MVTASASKARNRAAALGRPSTVRGMTIGARAVSGFWAPAVAAPAATIATATPETHRDRARYVYILMIACRRAVAGVHGNRTHPTRRRQVATVLKTAEATRPPPLPRSREHERAGPRSPHFTDLHGAGHARNIRGDAIRWNGDEEPAGCLRIEGNGTQRIARAIPFDLIVEKRMIALGAAGAHTARPRGDGAGKRGNGGHVDDQCDATGARDVRRVAEQREAGDVGGATHTHGERRAAGLGVERPHGIMER